MKNRLLAFVLAISLLLPIALLVANSNHYHQDSLLGSANLVFWNWLYMAFPQLLVGILAMIFIRTVSRVGVGTLLVLDALLICFQLWIWYAVPGRDGADAWLFYIPLWILVLIAAFLASWIGARRARRL
jgi:hypothetical protein